MDAELKKEVAILFKDLRRYGFVAQRGIMHTRRAASDFCVKLADKRKDKGIPVPGIVFYTRKDAGNLTVKIFCYSIEEEQERMMSMIWVLLGGRRVIVAKEDKSFLLERVVL